jgi:hypothetical protein
MGAMPLSQDQIKLKQKNDTQNKNQCGTTKSSGAKNIRI